MLAAAYDRCCGNGVPVFAQLIDEHGGALIDIVWLTVVVSAGDVNRNDAIAHDENLSGYGDEKGARVSTLGTWDR